MANFKIALDRASQRSYDANGHLRVERTPITRAVVSEYLGTEIPNAANLGLNPNRTYKLYRDANALKASAKTFAGKPILLRHQPISADDHPRDLVVGAIGDNVEFDGDALWAPITIWDADAIDAINDGSLKSLSCGYFYTPQMKPVVVNGERADGSMVDIEANHLALCRDPRVPGAVVADEMPKELKMAKPLTSKALMAQGAVLGHLLPLMAKDAKINLTPAFARVTAKNFKASIPQIAADCIKATRGKLAHDADISDLVELLNGLAGETPVEALGDPAAAVADPAAAAVGAPPVEEDEEGDPVDVAHVEAPAEGEGDPAAAVGEAPAEGGEGAPPAEGAGEAPAALGAPDPYAAIKEFLTGKLSEEDMAALTQLIAKVDATDEDPDEAAGMPPAEEENDEPVVAEDEDDDELNKESGDMPELGKTAMDAAIKGAIKLSNEIRAAEREVRPLVGDMNMSFDSAEAVYKAALKAKGVKVDGVHPSAYRSMVAMLPKPGASATRAAPAQDAAAAKGFTERFPSVARIGVI